MERLLRHIESAARDVAEHNDARCYGLARVRARDEAFLRRVMLGAQPWPAAAFGPEDRR